ncbi:MAG: polyphosphate:AMP phosphotransferase [Verrucomicrobia bacterium]|nr:polyphosphate:AMP phosphotransferase [Verrucomicrobiota bacterium]
MFEAAELGRKIPKAKYESELTKLRGRLLQAHFALRGTKMPVIVVVSGADGAGKGEFVHRLNEWLDPRGVDTVAFWGQSDEERERPPYWRFWRVLPGRGRIGILFGSWYSEPIIRRVYGETKNAALDTALDRITFFERMLAEDGALIIKLWFHLSKKAQRKQLKELDKDPKTHWRVLPSDWKHLKLYDKFTEVSERAIRHTDAGHAPWHVIEAADRRYRELTAGTIITETLEKRLKQLAAAPKPAPRAAAKAPPKDSLTILDHVDLSQKLTDAEYKEQLEKYQSKLGKLVWAANAKKISTVMPLEGWDAGGKGSAIRRVTAAMDPRLYRIIPVAAPTEEERAQHYLWRFWRHLPRAGMVTIYDRTWYGRVLVERVEGFATDAEWQRAFLEINDFEEQLTEGGNVVVKFWVHISKDEQLRRFKQRQQIAIKQYKITDEDWRNRERWDAYKAAVNDMVARTSTEFAPWTIVAGNDKKFARIQILKTICKRLEAAL